MSLKVAVILGTTRQERRTEKVAKLVYKIASYNTDLELTFVDPRDFNLPFDGNDESAKDPKYTKITLESDAFIIVSPEYNHSFPGSLKRLLDSELKNYIHKAVAFVGVSSGPWGGVRAIEALNQTVRELGLVSTFQDVHFPRVQNTFDDEGNLLDDEYIARIEKLLAELIWMATTLKWGRENLK